MTPQPMTPQHAASRGFRRGLASALPGWVDEGLISTQAAETIRVRYALDEVAGSMQGLLLMCIYMVGAALIGGGAITFVAANWSAIPQAGQAGLLISVLLALHLTGYHIGYQRKTHPGLGHALIVVGTLMYGASIPLFGQIFHIDGDWPAGVALWSVGAAAMALAVGSVPTALAVIAGSLFAHAGLGFRGDDPVWWYTPLLVVSGLAFGRLYHSSVVTAGTVVASVVALLFYAGGTNDFQGVVTAALVSGLLLTTAGLLYRWPAGAQTVGIAVILLFAYILSFEEPARSLFPSTARYLQPPAPLSLHGMILLPMVIGAAALWVRALLAGRVAATPRIVLAAVCAVAALVPCLAIMAGDATAVVLAANAMLLALGAVLIWAGVRLTQRAEFWVGMLVIGAVIIGRFLEIDSGLLAKSVVFTGCGIAVILAGIRFEKMLRQKGLAT